MITIVVHKCVLKPNAFDFFMSIDSKISEFADVEFNKWKNSEVGQWLHEHADISIDICERVLPITRNIRYVLEISATFDEPAYIYYKLKWG